MAPEVIIESQYDTSADIWSLGVLLYYIRTGEYPFRNTGDSLKVLLKIVRKIKFNGPIESKVKKFLKKHNVTYVNNTTLFEGKIMYYRHKHLITVSFS